MIRFIRNLTCAISPLLIVAGTFALSAPPTSSLEIQGVHLGASPAEVNNAFSRRMKIPALKSLNGRQEPTEKVHFLNLPGMQAEYYHDFISPNRQEELCAMYTLPPNENKAIYLARSVRFNEDQAPGVAAVLSELEDHYGTASRSWETGGRKCLYYAVKDDGSVARTFFVVPDEFISSIRSGIDPVQMNPFFSVSCHPSFLGDAGAFCVFTDGDFSIRTEGYGLFKFHDLKQFLFISVEPEENRGVISVRQINFYLCDFPTYRKAMRQTAKAISNMARDNKNSRQQSVNAKSAGVF